MTIESQIRIDLAQNGIPPIVSAMQFDANTRVVKVSLFANGVPFVPEDCTVSVAYKKPDGTSGWYDKLPDESEAVSVADNVVTAILAPQVLTAPGNVCAAIRLDAAPNRISSFPFIVSVTADPGNNAVKSENYYSVQNWHEVNDKFKEIVELIKDSTGAIIDDKNISYNSVWSSRKTVDSLCPSFTQSGAVVSCEPVEGYPLSVVSSIEAVQEGSGNPTGDNIRAIKGHTAVELTQKNDSLSKKIYQRQFNRTVYGGTLNWATGELTITHDNIPSYDGEEVPDGWISSTGELSDGAQVVYPLAEPTIVKLEPAEILALAGVNTLSSDTGITEVTGQMLPGHGTVEGAVLYTPQELTPEQQAQVRANIGVTFSGSTTDVELDDTTVGAAAWSSRNIVDKLCPGFSESGAVVSCEPVEGYPLSVVSSIEPTQEGSGDPRPAGWAVTDIVLSVGMEYGVITGVLTEGTKYKLAINATNAAGERVKLASAEVYDQRGSYAAPMDCEVGDYDVVFTMVKDSERDPANEGEPLCADIRLYFAEEVDESSLWQYDEGGDRSLVEGAYILSEYDPGNVRPITGFDSVQLWRGGKNLLPYPYANTTCTRAGITFTDNGDGTITVNGTATAKATFALTNALPATEAFGRLIMSGCPAGGSAATYSIANVISGHMDTGSGLTFLCNEKYKKWAITIATGTTVNNLVFKPQIELGEVATPYEPYRGDTFTAQLGQTVYGGSYDWETGILTIAYRILTVQNDRLKATGQYDHDASTNRYVLLSEDTGIMLPQDTVAVCDQLQLAKEHIWANDNHINAFTINSGTQLHMNLSNDLIGVTAEDDADTRTAAFKAFLQENPLTFVVPVKKPTTIQLDPAKILALSGENTLTSDTGDTTVSGKADPAALLTKLQETVAAQAAQISTLQAAAVNNA